MVPWAPHQRTPSSLLHVEQQHEEVVAGENQEDGQVAVGRRPAPSSCPARSEDAVVMVVAVDGSDLEKG